MPSIADSQKLVKESLAVDAGLDHDAILANLQHEIDKHNRVALDAEQHLRRRKHRRTQRDSEKVSDSDLRFRFKDGTIAGDRRSKRRRTKQRQRSPTEDNDETVHPFPREPVSTEAPADDAFLSSLLDALADDEAAAYWESVYSQPIHAYSRPTVRTERGELEEMSDEQYAAWVKEKMWEKQHPEIVLERDKMARKRREEEELKQKRKEEFIRQREKEAWDRASKHKPKEDYDFVFDLEGSQNSSEPSNSKLEWHKAWTEYISAWNKLNNHDADDKPQLPRPTLPSKPFTRPHIESFLRNVPLQDGQTRHRILRVERIRWHPDKIQQRLQGNADADMIRTATGIFQIIDAIWNDEISQQS